MLCTGINLNVTCPEITQLLQLLCMFYGTPKDIHKNCGWHTYHIKITQWVFVSNSTICYNRHQPSYLTDYPNRTPAIPNASLHGSPQHFVANAGVVSSTKLNMHINYSSFCQWRPGEVGALLHHTGYSWFLVCWLNTSMRKTPRLINYCPVTWLKDKLKITVQTTLETYSKNPMAKTFP